MAANQPLTFEHVIIDDKGSENPHIKAVGDVNRDGFVDVIVASSNGGPLVWYEYPGWKKHIIASSGRWSCDAKLADVDRDGDPDLVISEWYSLNRMEWYENPLPNGEASASPWKLHVIGSPRAHNIEVGDIDSDGRLGIVTRQQGKMGNEIVVWKQGGQDSWAKRLIDCPQGEGLALADINGDGRPDAIIGGRWYEAPKAVLREPWREHQFADWPVDAVVKVADMNKDGRPDVVLTRSEGPHHLSWFEAPSNPSRTTWTEHIVADSIAFAHSLEIGDINNDVALDVVVAEMHQSPRKRVTVFVNEGKALKWRQYVIATTGSHNLCLTDIGADGHLDMIGANWSGPYQPIEMWLSKP